LATRIRTEFPDAIEIAQSSDPNCPAGTTCIQLDNQQPAGAASSTFSDLIDVTQFNADPNLPSEIKNAQQFIAQAKDPSLLSRTNSRSPHSVQLGFARKLASTLGRRGASGIRNNLRSSP
jgi:hypothetical protein